MIRWPGMKKRTRKNRVRPLLETPQADNSPSSVPEQLHPRLPGGFNLPPFGIHQILAVVIVCIALWAVGGIWLGMQAASQWVGSWQQDIHIHVYLDNQHGDSLKRADQLQLELLKIEQIQAVRRISAEEAAAWMQGWLRDATLNKQDLVSRLPLTFELSLSNEQGSFLFDDIRDAASRFGGKVNEDEVNLARAHYWLSQASWLAWFASLILALAMALIISNTLRMTLLARADEIHLMRLLGAKEWFVRMPFILEGMVLGAAAGFAAWVLLWPIVWGSSAWMSTIQVDLNLWLLLPALLLGGGLVGTFGAVIATARVVSPETGV
ncbi:MAG: FtsX-like permease family protein [Mariprofundus sp.]